MIKAKLSRSEVADNNSVVSGAQVLAWAINNVVEFVWWLVISRQKNRMTIAVRKHTSTYFPGTMRIINRPLTRITLLPIVLCGEHY